MLNHFVGAVEERVRDGLDDRQMMMNTQLYHQDKLMHKTILIHLILNHKSLESSWSIS